MLNSFQHLSFKNEKLLHWTNNVILNQVQDDI